MLVPYPLEPPPRLPPLDEPWEGADAPLLSGRRARVRTDGAIDLAGVATITGPAGGAEERRFLALEEPCFVWQHAGSGTVRAGFTLRLRGTDAHFERSQDGTALWLTGEAHAAELLIACRGGTLELIEAEGLRLAVEGSGPVRLIFVAADDEGDRERTLRALARKGFAGLRTQRQQHRTRLDGIGTRLTTPDPVQNAAFDALAPALDARLIELAGGRRTFPDLLSDGVPLLALGHREPVRDVLRAPFDTPAALRLLAAYAQWAGDDDFLRKQWPRAAAALRDSGRSAEERRAATDLAAVADAMGDHATLGVIDGILAGGSADVAGTPSLLPAGLARLWGVEPAALDRAVTLAPALPAEWREMTLGRLRIGATTFDARVSRRPGGVGVKLRVTHGPVLLVRLVPVLPFLPTGVLLGAEQLPGPMVRFELAGETEATWVA